MSHALGSSGSDRLRARCVLLVSEAGAVPSSLVGALDRRGMDIDIVRQPPRVMLQLAQHPAPEYFVPTSPPAPGNERHPEEKPGREAQASAEPQAEPPPPGISVVIVEPPQQHHIPELRHALATYYPSVRCYRYDAHGPTGHPRLEAFDLPPTDINEPADPPADAAISSDETSPHIKGTGQRLRSVIVKAPADRPAAHDTPLVSEEELTMLLGPDEPLDFDPPSAQAGPKGE